MAVTWSTLSGENMLTVEIPRQYGYCILVAVGSIFVLMWKGIKVGMARKKYNVPYPTMYSNDNNKFNCFQRAHQNTLENYPQFLTVLLLGGLEHPVLSAAAGFVWLTGRIVYAQGYYTGDPANRMRGGFSYLGLLTLIGVNVKFALRLLGVI